MKNTEKLNNEQNRTYQMAFDYALYEAVKGYFEKGYCKTSLQENKLSLRFGMLNEKKKKAFRNAAKSFGKNTYLKHMPRKLLNQEVEIYLIGKENHDETKILCRGMAGDIWIVSCYRGKRTRVKFGFTFQ